jgi:aspartokinase/homoserine dehydrogenase 1
MKIKILKFGGSSIANVTRINTITDIILNQNNDTKIAVVLSAFGGVTNKLLDLSKSAAKGDSIQTGFQDFSNHHFEIIDELFPAGVSEIKNQVENYLNELKTDLRSVSNKKQITSQTQDKILSYGERLSSAILSHLLTQNNIPAEQLDARNVILTDNHFGNAYVYYQRSYDQIRAYCKNRDKMQIITGFIGATDEGQTTTLGRSGSDYTASIFGAALNASSIEIWTDVNGILSADPNIVPEAKTIFHITYEEAMELAHAGAKVIFPPTMIPALYKSIPIQIKNTFEPNNPGTIITQNRELDEHFAVGISSLYDITLIRFQGAGMIGRYGVIGRVFDALATEKINIILVSQVFSEHSICFAIQPEAVEVAESLLKNEFAFELKKHFIDSIKIEENLSLIAAVGEGMRHTPGISGQLFSVLGNKNVNIIAIAQGSSERNISFIINNEDVKPAIRSLHSYLFSAQNTGNIFIIGTGLVGTELIKLLHEKKDLCVCGISNSRKMILNQNGVNLDTVMDDLDGGEIANLDQFISKAIDAPNSIFVDVTSSPVVAEQTAFLIEKGVSVVSASKLANSMNQNYYDSIRENSKTSGAQFKYETNVGAGLPIIETLQTLIDTGDTIEKIEGVMSGTLSYLFSQFDGSIPFSQLVKKSRKNGFTEPDPRDDLNGMDVARKILILARETGVQLELSDVSVENLIPSEMDPNLSVDEFLDQIAKFDSYFLDRYESVKKEKKVLRYIATWEGEKAIVGLNTVGENNPFFHQNGRENFLVFTTRRYHDTPMVIKGHGAGAEVTAAGVLGDILKCKM